MLRALTLALLALTAAPAYASYDQTQGGTVTPSAISAGGQTDYSVSLTGRPAIVDVVLVLDNSGSMANNLGASGNSKWTNLASQSNTFVDSLNSSGFFSRGGRVGVVLFSDAATTAAAPTTDVSAIHNAIANGAPDAGSCIGCGIQRATDLLTAIPGAASHRQIAYVMADGANTVTPPTLADAAAASDAAHIERRVVGVGAGAASNGLEAADSNGVVPYPDSPSELGQAYAADPTSLPGATNVSWTFHVTPGFAASSPAASAGSVSVAGQDVTWTLSKLGAETATLTFHATHDAASGCGATALLTGTSFSDAEGDPAPPAGLGALTVSGCVTAPPSSPPAQPDTTPAVVDPTRAPSGLKVLQTVFGAPIVELTSLNFGTGTRGYGTTPVKNGRLSVPAKGGTVKVFGILCDGCKVTVAPTIVLKHRSVKLKTIRLVLKSAQAGVIKVRLTKAQVRLIKKTRGAKLKLAITLVRNSGGTVRRTFVLRLTVGK